MKIIVISGALGNPAARRCIDSLLDTIPVDDFDLNLVRERGFRERTLNAALSLVGTDDDVLFVGDDIEFTHGWYEAVMANYHKADILGLSTLYPGTTKVQDRGYDLVQIDGRITLEAKDRGLAQTEIAPFGVRRCDALCGCFMLVKANVFRLVPSFSEEGQNRWGEFIFLSQASRRGATVGVIDSFIYHGGESTKSNPDKALSSISYQLERHIWKDIVQRYVDPADVKITKRSKLDKEFQALLKDDTRRVLFYGIGTVTEFIVSRVQPEAERVAFCSGLPEEAGLEFYGQRVLSVNEVPFGEFDWIVMTPLLNGEKLSRQVVFPLLSEDFTGTVSAVEMETSESENIYWSREIEL